MPDRRHRGLLIRSSTIGGRNRAAVLAGDRRLHVAEAETLTGAEEAATTYIDAMMDREASARRNHVPTRQEYLLFFADHVIAKHEAAMLIANARAGDAGISAMDLARAAGWDDVGPVNLNYGYLGRLIADRFQLDLPQRDGTPIYTFALAGAASGDDSSDMNFRWRMHPELCDALRDLRLID